MLAIPDEFATLVQRFFADRLLQQQNASPRTIVAYRDTFYLLLKVAERERGTPPAKLALGDVDAQFIVDFLAHLQTVRHYTVRTRNARLAAIRAFAHYVARQCPPALALVQQILAIPMKRIETPLIGFLSREEMQALLAASDTTTWCGRRDRVMFALLYNTGARVSEMLGIRVADVTLAATSSVRLHGKGRQQRTVPLSKETAADLRHWLIYAGLGPDQPLLPNRQGSPITRTNVAERLTVAIASAAKQCPQVTGRTISAEAPEAWTGIYRT